MGWGKTWCEALSFRLGGQNHPSGHFCNFKNLRSISDNKIIFSWCLQSWGSNLASKIKYYTVWACSQSLSRFHLMSFSKGHRWTAISRPQLDFSRIHEFGGPDESESIKNIWKFIFNEFSSPGKSQFSKISKFKNFRFRPRKHPPTTENTSKRHAPGISREFVWCVRLFEEGKRHGAKHSPSDLGAHFPLRAISATLTFWGPFWHGNFDFHDDDTPDTHPLHRK